MWSWIASRWISSWRVSVTMKTAATARATGGVPLQTATMALDEAAMWLVERVSRATMATTVMARCPPSPPPTGFSSNLSFILLVRGGAGQMEMGVPLGHAIGKDVGLVGLG